MNNSMDKIREEFSAFDYCVEQLFFDALNSIQFRQNIGNDEIKELLID